MKRHQPSGRWGVGLGLSLLTVFMWGLLPIALQITLEEMDAITITWYRFLASGLLLASYLALRRTLPNPKTTGGIVLLLLAIATLGLGGNYLLYILGLSRTSAVATQVLIQLAPVLAMLGSLVLFHERFTGYQWLGLFVLGLGMGMFFHNKLTEIFIPLGRFSSGLWLLFLAAVLWAVYALAQKQLLSVMSSSQVLVVVYLGSSILLFPPAIPRAILHLGMLRVWLLAFCALNTLVAYGAFSEALAHWEASRVNAVLSLTPVATLTLVRVGSSLWPGIVAAEPMTRLSSAGAMLVVVGSMTIALARSHAPISTQGNIGSQSF